MKESGGEQNTHIIKLDRIINDGLGEIQDR